MGLFDFVRDIGRKIFTKDSDANDKIKAEIEASLKGVEGLTVDYDPASGMVTLGGKASDPAALQKAILIAGNTMGVSNVSTTGMKSPPRTTRSTTSSSRATRCRPSHSTSTRMRTSIPRSSRPTVK